MDLVYFFTFWETLYSTTTKSFHERALIAYEKSNSSPFLSISSLPSFVPFRCGGILSHRDRVSRVFPLDHGTLRRNLSVSDLSDQPPSRPPFPAPSRTAWGFDHYGGGVCGGMHPQPLSALGYLGLFPSATQSFGTDHACFFGDLVFAQYSRLRSVILFEQPYSGKLALRSAFAAERLAYKLVAPRAPAGAEWSQSPPLKKFFTELKKKRPLAPQHPALVKCCARKRTSKFRKKALTIPSIFDNIIVSIFKAKERFP